MEGWTIQAAPLNGKHIGGGHGWRGYTEGSLLSYCLRISDVCPIRFDLYFKRFLNRERMSQNKLPDIDIDFAHDVKDDVVDLLFARHGRDHCAVVGGFATFQARAAFADVAKVLGVAEREVRRFTECFPWSFGGGWKPDGPVPNGGAKLRETLANRPESRELPVNEEPFKTALDLAECLDGVPRNPKMHPCGVVLSCQPMHELTPTFISAKGYPTTHLDMDAVEQVGLVKPDVLAQGGLAVLRDAKASLKARGIGVDFGALEPWDDPAVWDMIAGGGARAVHHIESPAMTSLCQMTNVREIDGVIGIVAVIRPGAANENKKRSFTRRYQGLEPTTYPHPTLESCLRSTFGLPLLEPTALRYRKPTHPERRRNPPAPPKCPPGLYWPAFQETWNDKPGAFKFRSRKGRAGHVMRPALGEAKPLCYTFCYTFADRSASLVTPPRLRAASGARLRLPQMA